MTRTISEIYNAMIDEKSNYTQLSTLLPEAENFNNLKTDILSTSKVAIWRLYIYIVAVAIWIHEGLWDLFKDEITQIVIQSIPGTKQWYKAQSLLFQYGYNLEWINDKFQYSTIDEDAKIIKRCSVAEVGAQVQIKVSKLESDNPVPLTSDELSAFNSYLNKIKFAGTNVVPISYAADLLNVTYEVHYDPIIPFATVQANVESAINDYIANLPFDGILNITKLTDAIQVVEGVIDPVFVSAEAKWANAAEYEEFTQNYSSVSGYMNINNLTINYIANV